MNHAPENTLVSFEQALEDGAEAIEMDVQLSSDDHLVIFHDDDLKRVTGVPGLVKTPGPGSGSLTPGSGFIAASKGSVCPCLKRFWLAFVTVHCVLSWSSNPKLPRPGEGKWRGPFRR